MCLMNLDTHYRLGRYIFWFAQILGVVNVVSLILYMGVTLIGELINKEISIREDYSIFIILLCEVLVGISFVISWKKKRLGSILILFFVALVGILWGRDSPEILWFHLPMLVSGLLLLFYSFYKEWILKRKA